LTLTCVTESCECQETLVCINVDAYPGAVCLHRMHCRHYRVILPSMVAMIAEMNEIVVQIVIALQG